MQEITNLRDIIDIVRRRKLSIMLPASLIFILSVVTAFLIPPTYRSTSTILIEDQEIPRDYVASTVTGYAEQRLHTINQRIMSTPKLLEIINRYNLYAEMKQKKTTDEIIDKMRKDIKFDTVSADVIDPKTGRPTPATIAFTLSYKGKSPETVQKIANVLASLYLEENLRVRQEQTRGASVFMEEEMKSVQGKLAVMDAQISAYKQRNIDSIPELAQVNLQGLDQVDRDISQLNDQLRVLREREGYLATQIASIPKEETSTDKARLNELRAKLVNLRTRVSEEYPDVVKLKSEIAGMERQIRNSGGNDKDTRGENQAYVTLASQLAGTRAEIDGIKRQMAAFQDRKKSFRKRIEASPKVEEALKGMLLERNNLQVKFDDLSKKFLEAKVAHGLEKEQKGERFTLIDAARLPEKPVSPNVLAIILIGFVLGSGAGIGIAAMMEMNDHSLRSIESLGKLTGIPVLAAIPEIVTPADIVRSKALRTKGLVGGAVALVAMVVIFHFLVMDLDVFWARLMRRLMI